MTRYDKDKEKNGKIRPSNWHHHILKSKGTVPILARYTFTRTTADGLVQAPGLGPWLGCVIEVICDRSPSGSGIHHTWSIIGVGQKTEPWNKGCNEAIT